MSARRLRRPSGAVVGMAAFLAVTVGSTSVLFSTIAGSSPDDPVSYSAVFTDATRVVEGDEVRIAGVRVGRVEGVELTDDGLQVTHEATNVGSERAPWACGLAVSEGVVGLGEHAIRWDQIEDFIVPQHGRVHREVAAHPDGPPPSPSSQGSPSSGGTSTTSWG